MPRGGARPNSGPKPKQQKFRRLQIVGCPAIAADAPPHVVLAEIARGQPMQAQFFDEETGQPLGQPFSTYPTMDQRIQCAIEGAPYFASKMASIQTYVPPDGAAGGSPDEDSEELSDEELARIARSPPVEPQPAASGKRAHQPKAGAKRPAAVGKRRKA